MIIADTVFFVALGNKNDNFPAKAKQEVETNYLLWERWGNVGVVVSAGIFFCIRWQYLFTTITGNCAVLM